jgi:hypothetical protein
MFAVVEMGLWVLNDLMFGWVRAMRCDATGAMDAPEAVKPAQRCDQGNRAWRWCSCRWTVSSSIQSNRSLAELRYCEAVKL